MIRVLVSGFLAVGIAGLPASAGQSEARVPDPCSDKATAATADSLAARFDDHQFVFIGSTHGDLKIEEFLMCLVSRPSFTRRVTDIVEEQVSSGHQNLIDRYVLGLEQISPDSVT